ncbi:MAG TPA: hypothetical protein VK281_21415 [Xanthobacteraceae bacterium]|nr:hypothetical protein [Xanthobacteraceae bacterium]
MKFLEKLAALRQSLEAGGPPFHAPPEIIQIVHGASRHPRPRRVQTTWYDTASIAEF